MSLYLSHNVLLVKKRERDILWRWCGYLCAVDSGLISWEYKVHLA